MKWIDGLFRRLSGGEARGRRSRGDAELHEALEGLRESPELLLRELEQRPGCPDDETFSRFVSGQCNPLEKQRILGHILTCRPCLATLDDLTAEARASAREEARGAVPVRRPAPARRTWAWGLGLGAPAAAVCVVLALLISAPAVKMQLVVTRDALRTNGTPSVSEGGLLHEGDRFHLEISAREEGYFFLYAWNQAQGGKFIFPVPGFSDDNRTRKGEMVSVPDREGWVLRDTVPGEETIFLLFSRYPLGPEALSRLGDRLKQGPKDRSEIESLLEHHFSVEQRFSYHVE